MGKDRNEIDWCDAQDWVEDNRRYYRCTSCNKRLWPKENSHGFQLPRHKKKGWKIKRAKARKHVNK